jgi:hypothetical protein
MADDSSTHAANAGTGSVFGFMGAIFGALVCFIGCAAEVSALGRPHKVSGTVLAIAAIAFGVGAIVLVRLAIRLEHRFKGSPPARTAATATAPTGARHPRNGPVSRIIAAVAIVAVVAFVVAVSVSLHSGAVRSSYTQNHGLARRGTVTSVKSIHHYSRTSSSWTTYNFDVALTTPANGATSTVVQDPTKDFQDYDQGEPIKVLVDPKQLTYAEVPGQRLHSANWFVGPLVLVVIFGGLGAIITTEEIKHRRHRRASI